LRVRRWRLTDVARRSDVDVEHIVRPYADVSPPVGLVVGKIVVDDDRLGRIVEVALDVVEPRNLRALGPVERAFVESQTVRTVQAGGDYFHLALSIPVHDGIDLVEQPVAPENGAFVGEAQRARVRNPARIELDLEPFG